MMRKVACGLAVALVAAMAADKIERLNAKLGLWEISSTSQMNGAPPIPPEALAKMTPEQREKMEMYFKARAAQGPKATVHRSCMTQEKLDKSPFSDEKNKSCTRTIVNSTSTLLQFHEECTSEDGMKRSADGRFELVDADHMKGSMQVKAAGAQGRTMNINLDLTGKWLGPDCGAEAK